MVKKFIPVVAVFTLIALLLSGLPFQSAEASPDWWDTNWQYRMKLTFDKYAPSENLTNFPVLVHLTSIHSDFWAHINSSITTDDTKDLRFVDANDSTELYFEAENITYASSDALIWVKVPQIDAGSTDDFIYVYYGSAEAESDHHSASNVWSSNFTGVWHLKDLTESTIKDSTSDGNDGTKLAASEPIEADGKIGKAQDFDGIDDNITIANESNFDFTGAITIEFWLNFRSGPTFYDSMVTKGDSAWRVSFEMADTRIHFAFNGTSPWVVSNTFLSYDTWYYVTSVWNPTTGKMTIYLDAISDAESSSSGTGDTNDYAVMFGENAEATGRWLDGILDEIRISEIARSADWIKAQYLSMTDSFIAYGSPQEVPPPPPHHLL